MKTNRGVMAATAVVLMLALTALVPMMPSSDATSGELDIVSVDYRHGVVSYKVETTSPYIYVIILDESGSIQYLGPNHDVVGGAIFESFAKVLNPGNYILKVSGNNSDTADTKTFTVHPDAEGIDVPSLKAMVVGDSGKIDYVILPDGAVGDVTFRSSDSDVVSVDENGSITAIANGTAYITVTVDGKYSRTCCVTVSDYAGSFINIISADYYQGRVYYSIESDCPYVYVMIRDVDGNVVYTASNPTVKDGKVEASFNKELVDGTYRLYIQGPKSSVCSECEFKTIVSVSGIGVDVPNIVVGMDSEIIPGYTITPWNATNQDVTFASSDPSVVKVDGGKLFAVGPGTAFIEVTTVDGGFTGLFAVEVSNDVGTEIKVIAVSYDNGKISFSADTDCSYIYVTVLDMNGNVVDFGPTRTVVNGHIDSSFVKRLADGEYMLRVQGERSEVNHSMQFKVGNTVPVSDIVLDRKAISAVVGDRFDLNATILPDNATDKTIVWIITDESVISYDADGRFTLNSRFFC